MANNDYLKDLDNKLTGQGNNLQNLFNTFNTAFQALDLSLLLVINRKLGPELVGGISGFLGRMLSRLNKIADWMHLDRLLNILIWWQTLHNAYMLSNDLGQTLFSAISNVMAAIGFKDAEGNALNLSDILGKQIDELAQGVLGVTAWAGIKAEWKRLNRIYQAAANLLWSLQSIGQSIINAVEVVGGWVASIGNALRKFGTIGEKAFGWMNQSPNFDNKFFTGLENAQNVISQIDSVASEVLSVQQTVIQIGEQKKELEKALGEVGDAKQGTPPPEAAKQKEAGEAAKTASVTPAIPLESQTKPGT